METQLRVWIGLTLASLASFSGAGQSSSPATLPPLPPAPGPSIARPVRPVTPIGITNIPATIKPANLPPRIIPIPQPQGIPLQTVGTQPPMTALVPLPPDVIAWEGDRKEAKALPGATNVYMSFWFTNVSSSEVLINRVRTSCGCTVAKMPSQPWPIPGGTNAELRFIVDIRGKMGTLSKMATIETSKGYKTVSLVTHIPTPAVMANMGDRAKNMQIAAADRQAVFKNDCASCHAQPTVGKTGQELYAAACGICHDSDHRASMVPDLRALKHPTNKEYWQHWITQGKPASLMPAFSKAEGGPLTDQQIVSLVEFLDSSSFKAQATALAPASPLPAGAAHLQAPAVQ